MQAALAGNTAQLPFSEGKFCIEPLTTEDAIVSGCLNAQAGAIERMFKHIEKEEGATCLISGGGAGRISSCLHIPFIMVDNMILEGLVHFGASL
jgi:type III pantothenate kinase